jgi:hypothetical protein
VFFNVRGHLPDDNGFLNTNTTPQGLFLKADFLPFLFLGPALVMPRELVYRLVAMGAILKLRFKSQQFFLILTQITFLVFA